MINSVDEWILLVHFTSANLSERSVFFCRHLYPPPSPIYAGGANGSYVRGVSFCHDGRHIASVADDGYVFISQASSHCALKILYSKCLKTLISLNDTSLEVLKDTL